MVLYTKSRLAFHTNALDAFVIEVHMRYFNVGVVTYRFGINAKPMILGSYFTYTINDIFYRVVETPVPVVHFKSWYIVGQSQ